jgi:hypothetical protein
MNEENIIGFDALYYSAIECTKGVMWKPTVSHYYLDIINETIKLEASLKDKTYKQRRPRVFTIYEPKKREVMSIAFRDRVYQKRVSQECYRQIKNKLIYDNWACQKGKGPDKAKDRLKHQLLSYYNKYHTSEGYYLQCDIKKYYPSIPHDKAKEVFKKMVDEKLAKRICDILDSFPGEVGFNPGNEIIQNLGMIYLNSLDHYIKEKLRIKWYQRYNDDFILISNSKEELINAKAKIKKILSNLGLQFNEKKTKIRKLDKGIIYLGSKFTLTKDGTVLRFIDTEKLNNKKRKFRRMVKSCEKGKIAKFVVDQHYDSYRVTIQQNDSKKLLPKMDCFYKNLWRSNYEIC